MPMDRFAPGLDVGLNLPSRRSGRALDHQQLLAIAEAVDEEASWDSIWVGDSAIALPFYESIVLLSACAARTQRVRLGIGCMATIGLRHPLLLAQQLANLDALSQGRLTLVACPGWGSGDDVRRELDAFSISYTEKVARMEQNIAFLRRLSGEDRASFHEPVRVDNLELTPGFVQRPFPIWLAANPAADASPATTERLLARVARLGDGWETYAIAPALLRERVARVRQLRAELGREDEHFPISVYTYANVNHDEAAALRDVAAVWSKQSTRSLNAAELQSISAIGTPQRCSEFIAGLVDAGATGVVLDLLSEDHERQLLTVTEDLLPLLASLRPAARSTNPLAAGHMN
jgi:alkanesulfonate monooxygenase SsuD/methylene tetrahydromethanopterin reductase-like flavin-dependent oxidoreductase (luciferase family)